MLKQGYSKPELYRYDGDTDKEWYVGFRFTCNTRQMRKPFQLRMGINYYATVKERDAEGKAAVELIRQQLEAGWNPFEMSITDFITSNQPAPVNPDLEDPALLCFPAAIEYAYNKKFSDLKKKSKDAYTSIKKFAKEAAEKIGLSRVLIGDIRRLHVKQLLEQMGKDRQAAYDLKALAETAKKGHEVKARIFSPNSYNKYKSYLSAFFDELGEWDAMEYNPCEKIKDKDPIESGIHRHATDEELNIIKEKLPEIDPELYALCRFEYVTGMRPGEILQTTYDMVDWLNSVIRLSYLEGKTRIFREVPVPGYLLDWIRQRQSNNPGYYLLFGRGLRTGPKGIRTNQLSRRWTDRVKGKLGIDVSLYSFKGLGGDAKRDAGIGLKAVSVGWGHADVSTSKIYLRKEGERLRKQVIANSPDL